MTTTMTPLPGLRAGFAGATPIGMPNRPSPTMDEKSFADRFNQALTEVESMDDRSEPLEPSDSVSKQDTRGGPDHLDAARSDRSPNSVGAPDRPDEAREHGGEADKASNAVAKEASDKVEDSPETPGDIGVLVANNLNAVAQSETSELQLTSVSQDVLRADSGGTVTAADFAVELAVPDASAETQPAGMEAVAGRPGDLGTTQDAASEDAASQDATVQDATVQDTAAQTNTAQLVSSSEVTDLQTPTATPDAASPALPLGGVTEDLAGAIPEAGEAQTAMAATQAVHELDDESAGFEPEAASDLTGSPSAFGKAVAEASNGDPVSHNGAHGDSAMPPVGSPASSGANAGDSESIELATNTNSAAPIDLGPNLVAVETTSSPPTSPVPTSGLSNGPQQVTMDAAISRIADTVEALSKQPPPRAISLDFGEAHGIRVRIAIDANGINVTVADAGAGTSDTANWQRQLSDSFEQQQQRDRENQRASDDNEEGPQVSRNLANPTRQDADLRL